MRLEFYAVGSPPLIGVSVGLGAPGSLVGIGIDEARMVSITSQPTGIWGRAGVLTHRGHSQDCGSWSAGQATPDVPASFPPSDLDGEGSRRRILLPFSGSATAHLALEFTARSASATKGEVWLLYVRIFDVARGGCYYLETPHQARACAQAAADRLRCAGVACSCITRNARQDKVVRTILAEAEALEATQIILGTRDRTRLGALILGSTSSAVARRSRRQVVLVRG